MRILLPLGFPSPSLSDGPDQALGICEIQSQLDVAEDEMNNTGDGSAGMGQDSSMAQGQGYGSDTWANMSPYSQSPYGNSPMNEYSGFAFTPHGLPSESLGRMPPPPPQPQHHQMIQPAPSHMGHPHLPMLNTAWPSQLTNPTPSGSYSAPPLSMPPVTTPIAAETPRAAAPHDKARRTLTTEQKRAMCQYHEDNPGVRQADIGAKFGVERSTVSKVLRHRDQYLKRDQEPVEPQGAKRGKAKHPDFDRTLSNYVRRQQQRGFDIRDDEIMEQAKLFAHGSGNQENLLSRLTSSWLQKFKQKHGIGTGRLMRRASETNIPDSARMSMSYRDVRRGRKSSGVSPSSPTGQLSPLSGSRSDEDAQNDAFDFDLHYRTAGSHSTTSLASDLRDTGTSSFSGSAMSPTGPFEFSPDPNLGAFPRDQNLHLRSGPPEFHREKRSNTFPSLNLEYATQHTATSDSMTPRNQPLSAAPSSTIESPASEHQVAPFGIDTKLTSPPMLHRSSSSSSITSRPAGTPVSNIAKGSTPIDASPVSPSQEDARRAANTLLNYIQSTNSSGQFDQSEYLAVIQLTKKLQLHQHQQSRPSIGGLSRIPEGDGEAANMTGLALQSR